MKNILSMDEALKINFYNEYHTKSLLESKATLDEISKFYPVKAEVTLLEHSDNTFSLDYVNMFLTNDVCRIGIKFDSYRKKYSIYCHENYKNVDFYKISNIKEKFTAPKNIGVLTTKKIGAWVKYIQDVHIECVKLDNELTNGVDAFLKSIEGEDVRWFNSKTQGEIVKNGIKFSFKIEKGYVSKKIEVHYSVNSDLETFKKLANNRLGLEKKLERVA